MLNITEKIRISEHSSSKHLKQWSERYDNRAERVVRNDLEWHFLLIEEQFGTSIEIGENSI